MSFKELDIPLSLNSSESLPSSDFFNPVLERAKQFDVAIGYFSSTWIRECAKGIASFAANGGECRWLISPCLNAEDWETLSTCDKNVRETKLREAILRDANRLCSLLEHEPRTALSWLIRDGLFKFKIAVPTKALSGMLHAKVGYFTDGCGNELAFSGSYNLTAAAETNWEVIELFSSWRDGDTGRVAEKRLLLEKLWAGEDRNLDLFSPTDVEVAPFIEITKHSERPYARRLIRKYVDVQIPEKFVESGSLRPHQETAIQNWFLANGHGIMNMATGAGKTVTALALTVKLLRVVRDQSKALRVVIAVPLRHLAEQWKQECDSFGLKPIVCSGDYKDWPSRLHSAEARLKLGLLDFNCLIVVNNTLKSLKFREMLASINGNFLFISDEVHNLGSREFRALLPENANFRLGLSATPLRHFDAVGSERLTQYFGSEVIRYEISDAIRDGTLTPYYYYPTIVELTEDEAEDYVELSRLIAKGFATGQTVESEYLSNLMVKRARLLGAASNKIPALENLMRDICVKYALVYVGDGDDGIAEKQIDAVSRALGRTLNIRLRRFTSRESLIERKELLRQFASGELDALVAIKCLDEGVDIPVVQKAFIIASSRNPRQFIQRRGRVLRRAEGKTFAEIYDFVVVPPRTAPVNEAERNLVRNELIRVEEFAHTAINGPAASASLLEIRSRYSLLDL